MITVLYNGTGRLILYHCSVLLSSREMDGNGGGGRGPWSNTVAAENRKRTNDVSSTACNPRVNDELYSELWRACAGPLVYVPHAGEKVFYFPQGHLEQVKEFTRKEGEIDMPIYNVPSKILCEVVDVRLRVDPGTDEVFAQITLLPVKMEKEPSLDERHSPPTLAKVKSCFFSKKLSPSDTGAHGGFSLPKRHADEFLPPLDMRQQPPSQELVAKDLHGYEWCFRHIYRGQPRRHLLTSGWSMFVCSKNLDAGDTFIFLRGENGEFGVGVRRAEVHNIAALSIISGHGLQHGILANAFHAVSTETRFTVYYHPWKSPCEFLIPFDRYKKSIEINYSAGTRFRMRIEGKNSAEERVVGIVNGIKDIDPIRWPDSEWRSIEVKWDSATRALPSSERISPWDIEMIECSSEKKPAYECHQKKRPRSLDPSSSSFYLCANSNLAFHLNNLPSQKFSASNVNHPNTASQELLASEPTGKTENSLAQANGGSRCMVFGVDLINDLPELPSLQFTKSSRSNGSSSKSDSATPTSWTNDSETIQGSEPSKSRPNIHSENQCRNCRSFQKCTKVFKHGTPLGRSVDLGRLNGYNELIAQLDEMFEFKGSLIDGRSGWNVTFVDNDEDLMLIGDTPWQKFQREVQRVLIIPEEANDKQKPKL